MADFGVTSTGFNLKRLPDILSDIQTNLSTITDPDTGEQLTPNLADENDPLVQIVNSVADQLSVCWEQLQMCYNQFDPLKATGAGLSGLVQLNGILRQTGESDEDLRIRQQRETSAASFRQIDAIFSGLIAIPDVIFCRVYQNNTINIDSRGIPAKSIAAIVVGGDPITISELLFSKVPVGVGYYGNITNNITDEQGFVHAISFQRPVEVPITINIGISSVEGAALPSDLGDQIKQAIVNYAQYGLIPNVGFGPGADVIQTKLYVPANVSYGYQINYLNIARDSETPLPQNVTILWNEVASFSTDRITVLNS